MRSEADKVALEQSVGAIDAALQTLLTARVVLIDRLGAQEPEKDPYATMGGGGVDPETCKHLSKSSAATMGGEEMWFCDDCGEQVAGA